ncbi:MAG: STAS domain-containing protein [Magnetococcus sp. DMHC-6]
MIIDQLEKEIIVRFRKKRLTFQIYKAFQSFLETVEHLQEGRIIFDFSHIVFIDASVLAMFMEMFLKLGHGVIKVELSNLNPKLHSQFLLLDSALNTRIVENFTSDHLKTKKRELFWKVVKARSQIHFSTTSPKKTTLSPTTQDRREQAIKILNYLQKN